MIKQTIYIRLLDEGTDVILPTRAEHLGENIYRVLPIENYSASDEIWEFAPNTIVKCELKNKWGEEEVLLAVEKID